MRVLALMAPLVLFACAAADEGGSGAGASAADGAGSAGPAAALAMIEVSGVGFFGGSRTRVYADDTMESETFGEGRTLTHRRQKSAPGAFARAAAVIAAEGAAARAALDRTEVACLDYGTDLVWANPAIAGFSRISAQCPDPAVQGLMDHVLAALAAP